LSEPENLGCASHYTHNQPFNLTNQCTQRARSSQKFDKNAHNTQKESIIKIHIEKKRETEEKSNQLSHKTNIIRPKIHSGHFLLSHC
jgi:hypothetical protein